MSLFKPARVVSPPKGVGMILAVVVPVMFATALFSVLVAVLLVPIIDFTPIIALWFALSARRWEGAPARLFGSIAVLAAIMLVQWAGWWAVLLTGDMGRGAGGLGEAVGAFFGTLLAFYPAELALLTALTAVGCGLTYAHIRAARRAVPIVATAD